MHIYIYLHTYAYAYLCTRIRMRMHDTVHTPKHWYWDPQSMHTHTYAQEYACACMTPSTRRSTDTETHNLCTNMHTHTRTHVYKCIHIHIHTHMHIYAYIHVRTHTHIHIYTHTYKMYICTHTSTPGTTARQRPRKELMQTQEALHVSFVRRNQSRWAPPMLGFHCTHFLRHQYSSTPHPLFPTYPRTVRGPRILGGRGFDVPHWSIQQCAPLWRSSAQLHNGPLHSCRKIGGKAAVQQNRSRRARRNPSPRMIKMTVHEKRDVEKRPNPATAHHTIKTARHLDNIRSSALVRGRSTQFMANSCRWPQRRSPEMRLHFRHFRGLSHVWLRIPDHNPFEQTAPSKLRSVSPSQWIFFVLFFLIAVCWLKTQLRSTIFLPLGSQKTLTLKLLLALSLRSSRLSLPTPIGNEPRSVGSRCCWSHSFCFLYLKDASAQGYTRIPMLAFSYINSWLLLLLETVI